jgi:ADP-dependent phosphofructokinase/glucokinase
MSNDFSLGVTGAIEPNITFFGGASKEVLRLSKDGIWANPDIPADEAAKLVLAAIDQNIKVMVDKAVEAEREACVKMCDLAMLQNQEAINELEDDEHIAKCFIQGAMTQLVKTSKAIRARGQA